MPLIIVTGTPSSGKSYRARQIFEDFEARIAQTPSVSVVYLPSYHASRDPTASNENDFEAPTNAQNPRDVIYDSARLEKIARAEEFSAIKRALNKNTVVIADSPNYIKGFRYQLFCEAKAAGTRHVVLHTAARQDECESWNNARLIAWGRETANEPSQNVKVNAAGVGPKIGKDVLGELEPESHTALYGDTIFNGSRSRTSSTGAAGSDDDEEQDSIRRSRRADDTMTLKSLYISDRSELAAHQNVILPPQDLAIESISTLARALPNSRPPSSRSSLPYSPTTFKSLSMRYEPPSPFTRWDTPLFTVPSTDSHPPYDAIWEALFPAAAKSSSKKALLRERHEQERNARELAAQSSSTGSQTPQIPAVKQNAATVLPSATAPDALQTLESTTGEITKLVLAAAREAGVAEGEEHAVISITLSGGDGEEFTLEMEKPEGVALSQPKLQRSRRKFGQIQRGGIAHGQGHAVGRRAVAFEFGRFLEGEWTTEGMT